MAMPDSTTKPVPQPAREADPPAKPRATHRVQAVLILTAEVPRCVKPEHFLEYHRALLAGEEYQLPEEVLDEVCEAELRITGKALERGSLLACAAKAVQGFYATFEGKTRAESPARKTLAYEHYDLSDYPALRARLEIPEHANAAKAIGWGIELRLGVCSDCHRERDLTYLGLCPPCFKASTWEKNPEVRS